MGKEDWIKWFSELSVKDQKIAGGKGANLAEMYNNKFPVPPGFVITTVAYEYFLSRSGIGEQIKKIFSGTESTEEKVKAVRGLIMNSEFPEDLKEEIVDAYDVLDIDTENKKFSVSQTQSSERVSGNDKFKGATGTALDILRNSHEPPFVAVRSSAINEDSENSSFAGQHNSFLNVKGNEELIRCVKKSFASLFTLRVMEYRKKKGFVKETPIGVVVQKMIDSQKSGVVFSRDPMSANSSKNVVVESVWGLGSGIVSGKISPDFYVVGENFNILEKKISDKKIALTRNSSGRTEEIQLSDEVSKREVLTGHELKMLTGFVNRLEEHYKTPQDVEFAIDGNGIHLLQSRTITSEAKVGDLELEGNVLFSGQGVSQGISSGTVKILREKEDLKKIHRGNVAVIRNPEADLSIALQNSVAVISESGGSASHAAIVLREMGIPAVFGVKTARKDLRDGQIVTVDGFTGRIIEGQGVERKIEIKKIIPTEKIKIKTIIDLSDYASRAAESGVDSVGLVRLESLIAESGKHSIWYIKNGKLDEYIHSIYEGLRKISQNFENIWIRTTNFRSDEYNNLQGSPGKEEVNPMLGDHGIRFSLKNQDLLEAEFKAIKELADEYGNKRFGIILPKIVSVGEVREAKKVIENVGVPENVRIGVMIETPAAVQIINSLCEEGIDFVNLGVSDLAQHTLAVDRNNEDVKDLYDGMSPAVLNSIRYVLRRCRKYDVETSVCEDSQDKRSDEMIRFLIEEGVDSITTNPDRAYDISKVIGETRTTPEVGSYEVDLDKNQELEEQEEESEEVKETDHEEAILKALGEEDKYSPGFERGEETPQLNEAIPIESSHFEPHGVEPIGIQDGKIDLELPDEDILEAEQEIGGKVYEGQEDEALKVEAQREAVESEIRGQALSKLFGKEEPGGGEKKEEKKGSGEEEVLDIF
jgi:pyruvate, water dikinase